MKIQPLIICYDNNPQVTKKFQNVSFKMSNVKHKLTCSVDSDQKGASVLVAGRVGEGVRDCCFSLGKRLSRLVGPGGGNGSTVVGCSWLDPGQGH